MALIINRDRWSTRKKKARRSFVSKFKKPKQLDIDEENDDN